MKKLDQMLIRARSMLVKVASIFLSGNEDGFIDALGVEPEKYRQTAPDGTEGYDFLQALADTAVEDWKENIEP